MIKSYLFIIELDVPYAYLVSAESERGAWSAFLKEVSSCEIGVDGRYHSDFNGQDESLEQALYHVGILHRPDGAYYEQDGREYADLESLKRDWDISETETGKFSVSVNKCFDTLDEAIREVTGRPHYVGQIFISPNKKVQFVGTLRAPVGGKYNSPERLICETHQEQADRYVALGSHDRAIAELRCAVKLAHRSRIIFDCYRQIGDCYREMGAARKAISSYRAALKVATIYENREGVYYEIGKLYDAQRRYKDALHWYSLISDEELDEAVVDDTYNRIRELERIVSLLPVG